MCPERPQLILENARLYHIDDELLDRDFEFMVRDVSGYALQLPWWSPAGSHSGRGAARDASSAKPR